MKNLVVHHKKCLDGLGAAWCLFRSGEDNMEFLPALYGDKPPEVDGDTNVYIVDFSYSPEDTKLICDKANKVVLLDHHKTALDRILPVADQFRNFDASFCTTHKSGAGIAFDYVDDKFGLVADLPFHLPWQLAAIQDRDLWKFELPDTREITAFMRIEPMDIFQFDYMMEAFSKEDAVRDGSLALKIQKTHVENCIKSTMREVGFLGYKAAMVNANGQFASDIGDRLSGEYQVVLIYFDTADERKFSLRSRGDIDVSEMARQYGGGGHKNASGFSVPRGHYLATA